MCTSFVHRGGPVFVGMNLDNAVYYCLDGDFFTVEKHEFAADAAGEGAP